MAFHCNIDIQKIEIQQFIDRAHLVFLLFVLSGGSPHSEFDIAVLSHAVGVTPSDNDVIKHHYAHGVKHPLKL